MQIGCIVYKYPFCICQLVSDKRVLFSSNSGDGIVSWRRKEGCIESWFQRHSPHFKSFNDAGVCIDTEFPPLWCLVTMIQLAYIVLTTLSCLHFVSMKFKAIVFFFYFFLAFL